MNFAIKSSRIVAEGGVREGAVLISGEKIVDVVPAGRIPESWPCEDAGGLVVMSGLVDTHVHINEPGRTEWEGFETATKAAAAGGITTLVDMPLNCIPVTTSSAALAEKIRAAEGKIFVDCGFYGGLVPGNTHEIEPLIDSGVLGFKSFLVHSGIDDFPQVTEKDLRSGLPILARRGLPLLVHAELDRVPAPADLSPPRSYSTFLASRPDIWEVDAARLMIGLCQDYNARVHIVHLSSSQSLENLQSARLKGLPLTVETCPHYLTIAAESIPDGATQFKCAPPIRSAQNQKELWKALKSGIIDFIVSDHSPCIPALKLLETGDFTNAWGGIASLQLGLASVWTKARTHGFSISDVSRWMSSMPAEFVKLGGKKGRLASGYDADIVLWDPDREFLIRPEIMQQKHKLNPYMNLKLLGEVQRTYLRGSVVFDRGKFSGPRGNLIVAK